MNKNLNEPKGPRAPNALESNRSRFSLSTTMRWIMTCSATFTIIALGLIIFSLIRESITFFPEYQKSLKTYRESGLEYVDLLEKRYEAFIAIDHRLIEVRAHWLERMKKSDRHDHSRLDQSESAEAQKVFADYRRAGRDFREYLNNKLSTALEKSVTIGPAALSRAELLAHSSHLKSDLEQYREIQMDLAQRTKSLFEGLDGRDQTDEKVRRQLAAISRSNDAFHSNLDSHLSELDTWSPLAPAGKNEAIRAFFTGDEWTTANEKQDWYGLLPLISGSLLVSFIALIIAIPLGVGSAIYVNQLASPEERAFLKPTIEFISALPAVAVGFFGVMVFGELLRALSRVELFEWLPFFVVHERLNAFTAGCLLALMAIPTIFTLTEDALFSVRKEIQEASFAIGATRMQTIFSVMIPSALPGILSAILLGFGRVLGETMVVLLCAGNRVKIPEFSEGLAAIFDPVHTMTGMIAQEMGEVVYGDIHYRALFMVGLILFVVSLIINYGAQSLANRHRATQHRYGGQG